MDLNQDNPDRSHPSSPQIQQQNQRLPQFIDREEQENQDQDHPEKQSGMSFSLPSAIDPPTGDPHLAVSGAPLTSPTNPYFRPNKRKKGKGYARKQQAIEKKVQTLINNLKPVPLVPSKNLDFDKHEDLLKRLGLWDFAHVEFDRNIRADLIAQLVATYDPKLRCSYVNGFRIAVYRANLARAFRLPVKKEKGGNVVEGVNLDTEALSEESIKFIEDFMSKWVLLHDEMWMMPSEVLNWTRAIKDGHPEMVDWASLIWFMVEKELSQGDQLGDCYYASHLQYLIKSQREELLRAEPKMEEVDLVVEVKEEEDCGVGDGVKEEEDCGVGDGVKEEEDCGVGDGDGDTEERDVQNECQEKCDIVAEEPNVELSLGQDVGEKQGVKEVEVMDAEECEDDRPHWLLDGRNDMAGHFLQSCTLGTGPCLDSHQQRTQVDEEELEEEDDGEEEAEDRFDIKLDDSLAMEGLTGNVAQAAETNHFAFGAQGQLQHQYPLELLASGAEMQAALGSTSVLGNGGKREIEHEEDIFLNNSSKRLRTDGSMDLKPSEFGMCMEQMQQLMAKARMMYEEREHAANMGQQLLFNEMNKRESMILLLQRKEGEIARLERELFIMGNLLEGYRKALKETQKAFSEYRQRCPLPEEPMYKDAGPGGVMLSTAEIEKQRLKQEEIDRSNCLLLERTADDAFDKYASEFEKVVNQVCILEKRLIGLEDEVKLIKDRSAKHRVSETFECISEE